MSAFIALLLAVLPADAAPPAAVHPITAPAPTAEGPGKEVAVLAELPAVKIVSITLRARTVLPEHAAPVPVTIEVVHGAAVLTAMGASVPLSPGALVVLDAGTPHAVTPVDEEPVTLLVHHLLGGAK